MTQLYEEPAAIQQRNVTIPVTLLGARDNEVQQPVTRLTLNLFDGQAITASFDTMEPGYDGGFVSRYLIEEDPDSEALFSVYEDSVSGSIRLAGQLYKINPVLGGQHTISEVDESLMPPCGNILGEGLPPGGEEDAGDPLWVDHQIDIMVVYTTDAKNANGGDSGMISMCNLAVYETNLGYARSDIGQRVNIVYAGETVYTEGGNDVDYLTHLHDNGDGYMDEVHTLRDEYGADCVVCIYDQGYYCGVAWAVMCTLSSAFESSAFCVVKDSCATGYYSFSHELGHLMGSHHDRPNASGCALDPYSYGYRTTSGTYRTVMAYSPGTRINWWSNPYKFAPNGEVLGVVDSEENWRTLNNSATTVSAWRAAKDYSHNLSTTFNSNNGYAGNMFDIEPQTDVQITGMDVNIDAAVGTLAYLDVWYRSGTYYGNENSSTNWMLLGSVVTSAQGPDVPTHITLNNNVVFKAGWTYGMYVDLTSYDGTTQRLLYTSGGPTVYQDNFLRLTTGVGKAQGFGGSTFYYREWNGVIHYKGSSGHRSLYTTMDGGNGFAGNMFDLEPKIDLTINSFDLNIDNTGAGGTVHVDVWYKLGSYVGSETDPYDWTYVGSDFKSLGTGLGNYTRIAVGDIDLNEGSTYGFYVHVASYAAGHVLEYTNGSTTYENQDLKFIPGVGKDDNAFFGSTFSPRIWNGRLNYSLAPWINEGYALPGSMGYPYLYGSGMPLPGEPVNLTLRYARPNTRAILIMGGSALYIPFYGGTLVPNMDLFQFFPTGPSGTVVLNGFWPEGAPPGWSAYLQYWIRDPAGLRGFAASNAVRITTP